MKKDLYRNIPKVDELLSGKKVVELLTNKPRSLVLSCVREIIEETRKEISLLSEKDIKTFKISNELIIEKIILLVNKKDRYKLKKVINATGVVIHTNLGRSLISSSLSEHLVDVSTNYSTLEFDINNGKRGSRYDHVEELLCELTGAEAAMVVNNNAAAVMLVLSTLAKGKEVIVSRGQLVEIGGSFRIPEVMKLSGAKLVEVGATNKTHLKDYTEAITEETGLLLKVHTSNFKVLGFTSEVSSKELSDFAITKNIPVYDDLGSGMLIDLSKYGLAKEPTVQECINDGIDVVSFSGDKMLGGPQSGIIVGKKKYINVMKKNQLTRALRVDKMTLAALEGTLKLYRDEVSALKKIPTLQMLTKTYINISEIAESFVSELDVFDNINYKLVDDYSEVGGGSMPLEKLKTKTLVFTHKKLSPDKIVKCLRENEIPIIGRISDDQVVLDFRTISLEELIVIDKALKKLNEM